MNAKQISISDVEKAFEALKEVFKAESGKDMDDERFLVDDIATDILNILRQQATE